MRYPKYYFFQVTSKVTHYFLIYKKISELLFLKSMPPTFIHLLMTVCCVNMILL